MGNYKCHLDSNDWRQVDFYTKLIEVEKRITQSCKGCYERGCVSVNHWGGSWLDNVIYIHCCYCDYEEEVSGYNKELEEWDETAKIRSWFGDE
jgi:hypothetical protein